MLMLITGGSGSGKSALAEAAACRLPGPHIYLATMRPFGEEAQRRIARHRKMRAQKGFQTVECYQNLNELALHPGGTILLECLGNLTANELFSEREGSPKAAEEKIISSIQHLAARCSNLILVSNEVFSDGIPYDPDTRNYQKVLAGVNRLFAEQADCVVEAVYGIPWVQKGTQIW